MADPVRVKGFAKKSVDPPPAAPPPVKSPPAAPLSPVSKVSPPPVSAVQAPAAISVSPPPVEEPIASLEECGEPPAYEADLDEMRVWKRQNWKWTLYEKSGLLKDETPTEEE